MLLLLFLRDFIRPFNKLRYTWYIMKRALGSTLQVIKQIVSYGDVEVWEGGGGEDK